MEDWVPTVAVGICAGQPSSFPESDWMAVESVDRVYHFFASETELRELIRGKWKGRGVHALSCVPPEDRMSLVFELSSQAMHFELRSEPEGRSWTHRFWAILPSFSTRPPVRQTSLRKSIVLPLSEADSAIDADWGEWTWPGQARLQIQALERRRLHFHLELMEEAAVGSSSSRVLFFSGVLGDV